MSNQSSVDHPFNDPNVKLERKLRDFSQRSLEEQQEFKAMTWCQKCYKADLGMQDPIEYEWHGRIFVEGLCLVCHEPVATEIVEE